ncbi:S9 family peptidase [Candidatus Binatia bacterium]|nr:S9 family peptidase [Candidatus Binatia bacterium]
MADRRCAPCGSWPSAISAAAVAARGGVDLRSPLGQAHFDGGALYWIEGRPRDGGRQVVVRWTAGVSEDVLPPGFSARSRVNEYGGGAYAVTGGTVIFVNESDQRVYRVDPGGLPVPLTPAGRWSYADLTADAHRRRVLAVREDGTAGGEPVLTLVAIDLEAPGQPRVLAAGSDFYAAPRPGPDGRSLAWLQWNHPNMPWDGTELHVGRFDAGGGIVAARRVAGAADESVIQPTWSPDGDLYYSSDRSGWWNLYRDRDGTAEPLCPMNAEFAVPPWVFAATTFGFESAVALLCAYASGGSWRLGRIDLRTGTIESVPTPYTEISGLCVGPEAAVFCAGSPNLALSLVRLDLRSRAVTVLRSSQVAGAAPEALSVPEVVDFPTGGGHRAHGFFYPPVNGGFAGLPGERPPLLVLLHGGPTASASTALDWRIQFWTSRGFAVLDVNYRGSTGYGRAYRRLLDGQWGVADVEDCVAGASYLVDRGDVDGGRLAIRGGSAGGFTALCALTFHDTFAAGAVYYGISDLEALTVDTHKFESRYLDRLVGPYPERRDVYRARSPIHAVERLARPVILFQGSDDVVVPRVQSERLAEALRSRGLPVAYLCFAGEGHGFRRTENVARALEAELYFYGRVMGFVPAGGVPPVPIDNLEPAAAGRGRSGE